MLTDDSSLDTILALIRQLEAALLGLTQMRAFVGQGVELEMLESTIKQNETKLAAIRRKVIQ